MSLHIRHRMGPEDGALFGLHAGVQRLVQRFVGVEVPVEAGDLLRDLEERA
jgi:hypothetical protein